LTSYVELDFGQGIA